MNHFAERLAALRKSMIKKKISLYIIPAGDPHLGEYIPDHWRIIEWLTGFTGSAATVLITSKFAGLWTDSRYFIQAEEQLKKSGVTLMNTADTETGEIYKWIINHTPARSKIGIDGRIFSISRLRRLEGILKNSKIKVDIGCDLISELWDDRPLMPEDPAFDHDIRYCGVNNKEKIEKVRAKMNQIGVDYHLLTSPDDIMWLLNIRGNDVKYSPVLSLFAIIGEEQLLLFADERKIPVKMASGFDKLDIVLLPYEETAAIISSLPVESTILVAPTTTSSTIYRSLPEGITIIEDTSIPARLKSLKNRTEISNIEKVMVKDGVALTKFFFWLEENIDQETLTELSIAVILEELRSLQENYLGPSFRTIAAFNEHGALPHYTATTDTNSKISGNGILLIDSGGQYLDGTTDITRSIAIGRVSDLQKKDFTLVLKGMISLATAKFPAGTKGVQLDIMARKALWEHGLNYGHGTGHGVGFCLNVHEGPQSISPGVNPDSKNVIEPGMLISDEPAVYRVGEYGIRTENLILCYEDEETEFGRFLRFDTVSLCYIDKKLIDKSLLEPKEIEWLNRYHSEVYDNLSPHLTPDEKEWLMHKTKPM
ncbi:MAG TPA: aminopeptidase P family protein [Bacteroidales bacterium]|nr:aminopeptidase P family protein [Bacteroidales bacterium]